MIKKNTFIFIFLLFFLNVYAYPPIVITNVNVIPMDKEHVLTNQTVLVENGKIKAIGKKVKLPENSYLIDGTGKYLIPGLTDMHAHLYADNPATFPEEKVSAEFNVMLANGVTTVRLMAGNPFQLKLKEKINKGEMDGPRLFVSSPEFAGKKYMREFRGMEVNSPEKAVEAVKKAKSEGYDFIKMTMLITLPVYEALVQAAKAVGIRVIGHVNTDVKIRKAIESGQQVEHLDEYMEALLADNAPNNKISVSGFGIWKGDCWETLDYLDEKKIEEIAAYTQKYQVYNSPTNAFFVLSFGVGMDSTQITQLPDFKFIPAGERGKIFQALEFYENNLRNKASEERRKKFIETRYKLIQALHKKGCKLLAGSDAPSWFLGYGFTLHRELEQFVTAGLSPYAALQTATTVPAEFLGIKNENGTIEKGKVADMVLLDGNPFDNISNTKKIAGVFNKGKWYSKENLNKMLSEAEEAFK